VAALDQIGEKITAIKEEKTFSKIAIIFASEVMS